MSLSDDEVVSMITGMLKYFSLFLIYVSTSCPLTLGKLTSNKTRSGISSFLITDSKKLMASLPSLIALILFTILLSSKASVVSSISPSLSSTSKILIDLIIFLVFRNSKIKCTSFSRFRFHPYFATQVFHYLFCNCKAHTCAGIFLLVMKALKNDEYLVEIFHINANTVVFN